MDASWAIQLANEKNVGGVFAKANPSNGFPDDNSGLAPPESISNSEVKRSSADGSVGFPHVRVGHCQVPLRKTRLTAGFLLSAEKIMGSVKFFEQMFLTEQQRTLASLFTV